MSELLEFLGASALVVAVLGLFWKADDAISPAFRQDLAKWLLRVEPKPNLSGAVTLSAFLRVFGPDHLSLRCARMSLLLSTIAVLGFWLILFGPFIEGGLFFRFLFDPEMQGWRLLIPLLAANIIVDYGSLFVTRRVLGSVEKGSLSIPLALILDFLLSLLIFLMVYSTVVMALNTATNSFYWGPLQYLDMVIGSDQRWDNEEQIGEYNTVSAVLLTTFVSSAWLWFAAIGGAGSRFLASRKRSIDFLKRALAIQETPVRSIGIVAFFLLLGFYGVLKVVLTVADLVSRNLA